MANFGEDVFDIHGPVHFVFPEPFYEDQSEEYCQPESNSKNCQEKMQSCGEKQDVKTTDIAELVWNNSEEGAVRAERKKGNVQLEFCPKIKQKGEKIKRGTKDDTMLLNINFKTILVSYFKQKVFLKELNQVEAREVEAFTKRQPSFKSLAVFCRKGVQGSTLRKQLLHLAQSDIIARRILESRCLLQNKIQMIKFLQIFRRNVVDGGKITKWKDLLKK